MATLVYEDFPGTSTEYKVNFEYLNKTDVKVGSIDDNENLTPITTGWTWKDDTTIQFDSVPGGTIRIYRVTDVDDPIAVFYPTVAIRAIDLNNNFDQCLFRLQEIGTAVGDINIDIDNIQEEINSINEILLELSGIEILADVADLNAYNPPDDSVGSAIQVSDSTGWSGATNVTGTPAGFIGGSDLRVNLRITNDVAPSYAFISYSPVDPDGRYVAKAGDTMTGALILNADPSVDLGAATKQYVDSKVSGDPDNNTTYDLGGAVNGFDYQIQLVGSDLTTDTVTLSPGSNITFTGSTADGVTINAAASAQVNSDWNATSGVAEILNKPTIPTVNYPVTSVNTKTGAVVLSASDVGAATTAQGALADSAIQPGDNVSTLTNDAGYITLSDIPSSGVGTLQQVTDAGNTTTNDIAIGSATTRSFDKFKDLIEFISADLIRDHAEAIANLDLDQDFNLYDISDLPFRAAVADIVAITSGAINLNASGSATFSGNVDIGNVNTGGGVKTWASGFITLREDAGSGGITLYSGSTTNANKKAEILTDGSATFAGGITSSFGTNSSQKGNVAPLNDWSCYPARS